MSVYVILIFVHYYPESVYRQIIKLPLDDSKVLYLDIEEAVSSSI